MFHVPTSGRLTSTRLHSSVQDGNNGAFIVQSPEPGWILFLICSDGHGWEHVSLHARRVHRHRDDMRTPTWKEMAFVKRLCWDAEDCVVQFHPAESDYINLHPNVLHLWRPVGIEWPTPPSILVGPQTRAAFGSEAQQALDEVAR